MAAAPEQEPLEEELTCTICLEIFTEPVILSCRHSFCRACVEEVWREPDSGTYACPQCRTGSTVRPVLEKNFQLANIVERYMALEISKEAVPCSYCTKKKRSAVKSCLRCQVSMCSTHHGLHSENAMLKNHPLTDPTSDTAMGKCTVHQKLLEIYCKDDAICVCTFCALLGNHKGHEVISISEAVSELRNNLKEQQEKFRVSADTSQVALKGLQKEKQDALEAMKKKKINIEKKYKVLRQQIEDEEKEAYEQLNKEQIRVTSEIDGRILALQNLMKEFEESIDHLNDLSKKNEDILFIEGFNSLAKRFKDVSLPFIPTPYTSGEMQVTDPIRCTDEGTEEERDREMMIQLYGQTPILDPDTANPYLILTDNNRTVSASSQIQLFQRSAQRFDRWPQILGTECDLRVSYTFQPFYLRNFLLDSAFSLYNFFIFTLRPFQ
ncbi:E3 ubiquitin-protein ligase TRIM8-like isoform X2 [Pristis pectinata]|uniref:E3 ubiquitin-protein ligase TRIM8-like isoform X2 n=1 Tax=Pristis pectinata TaxID=685728 RepID=UPI00223E59CD|nr:E3 ubiquitin-protein ligase TRIM8-like isoform X2 [Pristis pectinata]